MVYGEMQGQLFTWLIACLVDRICFVLLIDNATQEKKFSYPQEKLK